MELYIKQRNNNSEMKTAILLAFVLFCGSKSEAANTTDEEGLYTYKAAVVEYFPNRNSSLSAAERLDFTTSQYIELIRSVTEDVELIVFPEATLTSGAGASSSSEVPLPYTDVLCNSTDIRYQEYLKQLSCAAVERNTTVVINMVEKENCTLNNATGFCPSSGIAYYNSDVALNELGSVSGKYRKWNLFGEYNLQPPANAELAVFTTKNNVSFGMFTCFDILFYEPPLNLTRNLGVKNILFPTMWFSELPFLTALQVQQMWAEENDVNLLSAGANNPAVGSGGTGIFIGNQGAESYEMIGGSGGTKVIVETLPKLEIGDNPFKKFAPIEEDVDALAKEMDSFYLIVDSSLPDSSSVVLNSSESTVAAEVCNGDTVKLCCEFNLRFSVDRNLSSITNKNQYVYHLLAFDGVRTFSGTRDGGIESCGIVACLNESLTSCGKRFSNYSEVVWPITFTNISVSANFVKSESRIQFPDSLLASIRPISPQYTSWTSSEANGTVRRTHSIHRPQNRLLTFGIFGRDFTRDSPVRESTNTGARLFNVNFFVIVVSLCILGLSFIHFC